MRLFGDAIVTPMFSLVRLAEIFVYPQLQWLVGFPRYSREWLMSPAISSRAGRSRSRLVFVLRLDDRRLVAGNRNAAECRIVLVSHSFDNTKKCENCAIDFPDLDHGWVAADGNMAQVVETIEKEHAGGHHEWFGHPVRLTMKGKEIEPTASHL